MRTVLFKGNEVALLGEEVKVMDKAKNFEVLDKNLETVKLETFKGKLVVISVFPSIDTGICALQTARFNNEIGKYSKDDVVLLNISVDLPFALGRFCADKGIDNAITTSDHINLDFGMKYGFVLDKVRLLARGVVIIGKDGVVKYVEYVENVSTHPNYEKVLEMIKENI